MDYNPENEFYCQQFIKQLEQISTAALSDINMRFIGGSERDLLENQSQYLRPAFDKLTKLIFDPLRTNDPAAMHRGYEQLRRLMVAAYLIGSHGTVTESGRKFFEHQRTAPARSSRAMKRDKKVVEIINAVRAEMKENRTKPTRGLKYASIILPGVTKRINRNVSDQTVRKYVREILTNP
jgi:hypothetical protein